MANIFPRWTNQLGFQIVVGAPIGLAAVAFVVWYWFSPEYTDVGYMPEQPVAYSHELHAGELGIDCRYCHNTVERGARAAIPPAATCMNCHKHVKKDSAKLALIRKSAETGEAVKWARVHMLPDYTFFDHSAHLAAGVGCVTCHGRIDQMEEVSQAKPLSMSWCLDCHRNPYPNLRPVAEVTNMSWDGAAEAYNPHQDPARGDRKLSPPEHCSGCHR